MKTKDVRGISVVGFAVLVLVLGAVVFAGMKVYERTTPASTAASDVTNTQAVTLPAKITTPGQLSTVEKALNAVDLTSETTALNNDLSSF